jgi:hypothetical protein
LAGDFDEAHMDYFVIERQRLVDDEASDLEWFENMKSLLSDVTVLMTTTDDFSPRFLVSVPTNYTERFVSKFAPNVLLMQLAPGPIRESAKFESSEVVYMANIADIIARVNAGDLRVFDEYLTGERGSTINSRNSVAPGAITAANYLSEQFRSFGFTVTQQAFQSGYAPNVIAEMPGYLYPGTIVVMGAHYDSRGPSVTSPTNRAPGGNDDGSGTAALLQFARIIAGDASRGWPRLRPKYTIQLQAYSGEEQGLLGSRARAQLMRRESRVIRGMLQADMIAFRRQSPLEATQCAFPNRNDNKELTARAMSLVRTYVPEVTVGYTTACCSDHQSFTEQGYAATQFFERNGAIADNMYHQAGDVVNRVGFDFTQFVQVTKAFIAVGSDLIDFD